LYGKFEEEFGLTKRALGVYERMCTVVPAEEKFNSYQLYIAKTIKYLGITATRPIYENAISALEDNAAAQICCEFAKLEASLQEIDRARTAFTYGAQMADPRRNPEYWGEWHSFEVSHGNEETFREMLRVKRGVQAAFSTVNYNAAEMGAGVPQQESLTNEEAMKMIAAREGIDTDEKERISGFVQGKRTAEVKDLDEVERRAAKLRKVTSTFVAATANNKNESEYDEEIDIDDEDEDDDETTEQNEAEACVHNVKTKAVPSAVFGGLATQVKETSA
jgi:pre-mRNA-splicing factor SYF1